MSSERVTKKTEIKTENIDDEIADAYAPEVQLVDDGNGINIQMMKSRSMQNFKEKTADDAPSADVAAENTEQKRCGGIAQIVTPLTKTQLLVNKSKARAMNKPLLTHINQLKRSSHYLAVLHKPKTAAPNQGRDGTRNLIQSQFKYKNVTAIGQ